MKIAVVKSSVYQDLWVSNITSNPYELFKTSLMRCPAIGLAEAYNADFIIVKDTDEFPCNSNKNCMDKKFTDSLKYSKESKRPDRSFLDETYHKHISIDEVSHLVDDIDWSKYNIVMCINTCIPARITLKYPNIMWSYWIGENNENLVTTKLDCYDLILNQDVMKENLPSFSIGFPYTYVGPKTIETIVKIHYTLNTIEKHGIFMEINNTKERPVINIPEEFVSISRESGQPITRHSQDILLNAKQLVEAKYYVKLLGRLIRGNSCLESASAGTLILADHDKVMYSDLILPECRIKSYNDVILKIKYFDANPIEYENAIERQRCILNLNYFNGPYEKLIEKYKLFNINPPRP